ncbi:MAG TPA: SHOCT domain-containing protein [Patescibacteria group bacterium]|nr:SHOCT domain-containing protein [Patescibacteria group bacterium]
MKIVVYPNHIEYSSFGLSNVIPISNISDLMGIPLTNMVKVILNSGGKVDLYPKNKKEFIQAVQQALATNNTQQQSNNNLDDLEKLAELRKKKIITEDEFEKKKKQLLGI